jgi:hypothetical protein
MTNDETIKVLEEVVHYLKYQVEHIKYVPGHSSRGGIGGCSMACGTPQEPKCLYRKAEKLLNELMKKGS